MRQDTNLASAHLALAIIFYLGLDYNLPLAQMSYFSRNLLLAIMVLISLYLPACRKDVGPSGPFTKAQYPISVGNSWRYQRFDSSTKVLDTIQLTVVSKEFRKSNILYRCTITQGSKALDSPQFWVSDTSIAYKDNSNYGSYFGDFKIDVPFSDCSYRFGYCLGDTVRSMGFLQEHSVPAGTFPAFVLTRRFESFNYAILQQTFLAPRIGIIEMSIEFFNGGVLYRAHTQLIDYKVGGQ